MQQDKLKKNRGVYKCQRFGTLQLGGIHSRPYLNSLSIMLKYDMSKFEPS